MRRPSIRCWLARRDIRRQVYCLPSGVGTLLFAAIGVVVQLKDALNTVWDVEAPAGGGIWNFIRTYLVSLAGVLGVGFLLLISMLLSTALAAIGKFVAPLLPEFVFQVLEFAVSFAVITLLFAMMFKWLPDAQIAWRDVWVGAAVTSLLFDFGKLAIGLYIGKQGLESTYGAAASIVVVLIWVYYSAQIVLMGADSPMSTRYGWGLSRERHPPGQQCPHAPHTKRLTRSRMRRSSPLLVPFAWAFIWASSFQAERLEGQIEMKRLAGCEFASNRACISPSSWDSFSIPERCPWFCTAEVFLEFVTNLGRSRSGVWS